MCILLETNVLWSSDYELNQKNVFDHMAAQFSGIPPIHNHEGYLVVTEDLMKIDGDVELEIRLSEITELYRGFDENYPRNFIKNFGMFCQPVRVKYFQDFSYKIIYLIVGYNFFGCAKGQALFDLLQELLS
ncbi:hypothetical protein [Pedobacter cryoconitis]|uniref:Uncharacterized protein n=1 Tax=Pedobacter cryoconitis TaxID=188932 RepID=A0A327RTQ5_9SPHI|nr:hypothetical protein [Pedobacter cryoconitis]RAJ19875.1 hypothetical protein LY11_05262 [Pedobacter cryoconitis]